VDLISSLWTTIRQLDIVVFFLINRIGQNALFDVFMPFISNIRNFYIPLIIAWLFLVIRKSVKTRTIAVGFLLLISLSETLSSDILKPAFNRPRPFDTLSHVHLYDRMQKIWRITPKLEKVVEGQSRALPSSHATNIFAAAFYLSFFFRKWWPFFYSIAFLVGYSRIYLGVHFPFDVLAGAVIGTLCGLLLVWPSTCIIRRFENK